MDTLKLKQASAYLDNVGGILKDMVFPEVKESNLDKSTIRFLRSAMGSVFDIKDDLDELVEIFEKDTDCTGCKENE